MKRGLLVLGVFFLFFLSGCASVKNPFSENKTGSVQARDDFGCWPSSCSSIPNQQWQQQCEDWKAGKTVYMPDDCSAAVTPNCIKLCNIEKGSRTKNGNQGTHPVPNTLPNVEMNTKKWNAPTEGVGGNILYAENLPSCQGTDLFNSPLAIEGTYDSISPLGQTSSPGHTFPVDHLYFNLKRTTQGDYSSPSLPATILSPGDIEIFQINTIMYEKDGKDIGSDYHIWFAPCREVTAYLGHVTSLNSKIKNAIDHADQKSCGTPYSTGSPPNTMLKPCSYSLLLHLKSGEEIGTSGGPSVMTFLAAFDLGVYDQRIPALPFINQRYWTPHNLHAVCGVHYYPDGPVKASLLSKINNVKKETSGFPGCGTNMWDKIGSAQGNWVLPDTPVGRVPDMQGLAAIHLNTDPSQGLIDWGGAIAPADRIQFTIVSNGVVNRDPADIKVDGSVYCFEDTNHRSANARSVMLQLVDNNTLKAEYLNSACPSFLAFSNPTTYSR